MAAQLSAVIEQTTLAGLTEKFQQLLLVRESLLSACSWSHYRYCIYMDTAKLFTTGGSQAVRLPKDYRFEGTVVFIRKEGKAVIIEPKSKRRWPRDFFKKIRISDRAFRRPDQGSLPPVPSL